MLDSNSQAYLDAMLWFDSRMQLTCIFLQHSPMSVKAWHGTTQCHASLSYVGSARGCLMLLPPSDCRMTVRQFAWASHEQGGPFVIYDVSEGLVYVDRQYVPSCQRVADCVLENLRLLIHPSRAQEHVRHTNLCPLK